MFVGLFISLGGFDSVGGGLFFIKVTTTTVLTDYDGSRAVSVTHGDRTVRFDDFMGGAAQTASVSGSGFGTFRM